MALGNRGQENVRVIDLGVVLLEAIGESRGLNGSFRRKFISGKKVSSNDLQSSWFHLASLVVLLQRKRTLRKRPIGRASL